MHLGKWLKSARYELVPSVERASLEKALEAFRVGLHRRYALSHGIKAEPPLAHCGSISCIPLAE